MGVADTDGAALPIETRDGVNVTAREKIGVFDTRAGVGVAAIVVEFGKIGFIAGVGNTCDNVCVSCVSGTVMLV